MGEENEWTSVGEQIRRVRLGAGLSQTTLGERVGLDRTMISKIEAGTRHIDALELIKLSSALDVPMGYFLSPSPPVISRRATVLTEDNDTEEARKSQRLEIALVTWLRNVRQLMELGVLEPSPVLKYRKKIDSENTARAAAYWVRERLGFGTDPIETLMDLCEECGQLVLVTDLPGEGASVIDDDVAVAIVSRQSDPGRRRATAAHELGHLIAKDEYSSDLMVHTSRADREHVIDAFASELLLPTAALTNQGSAGPITRDQLVLITARYRTSWSLALRQAEHAGVIDASTRRAWNQRPTRAELMDAVGWAPQPDLDAIRVPRGYADAVMEAWKCNLISRGRAVELMHGQFTLEDWPVDDEADIAP